MYALSHSHKGNITELERATLKVGLYIHEFKGRYVQHFACERVNYACTQAIKDSGI